MSRRTNTVLATLAVLGLLLVAIAPVALGLSWLAAGVEMRGGGLTSLASAVLNGLSGLSWL
jgi:hypothetical protein